MNEKQKNENCSITVYFDGECPLCAREVSWMKSKKGTISYTDITKSDFSNLEKTKNELMTEIHAQLDNGEWIYGMDVIRKMYEDVGLGLLVSPTKWPILKTIFDFIYKIFAKYRVSLFQSKK